MPASLLLQLMPGMEDMPGMDHGADAVMSIIFYELVLVRWLHFAALFVLAGSSFFWLIVPAPERFEPAQRATLRLMQAAAPIALVTGLGWLWGMLANMTGGFAPALLLDNLRLFFFETQFGPVWAVRLAGLAGGAAAVFWRGPLPEMFRVIVILAGLLLFSQALLGHAAEGGFDARGLVMIAVYGLHMAAGAAWAGGLPALLLALTRGRPGAAAPLSGAYELLALYSLLGSVAVALILVSGLASAWFRTAGSFGVLVHTDYGLVLAIKLGLAGLMLGLAAYNRFIAMPSLRRARGDLRGLRRSIACESGAGLLVLAAAAVLGLTPPPQ